MTLRRAPIPSWAMILTALMAGFGSTYECSQLMSVSELLTLRDEMSRASSSACLASLPDETASVLAALALARALSDTRPA